MRLAALSLLPLSLALPLPATAEILSDPKPGVAAAFDILAASVDRREFEAMKARFYELTGLNSEGVPRAEWHQKLALAATSHPDFDDTPLEDEDGDGNPGNDGAKWHSH